jgi:hypothetical protein
VKEVYAQVNDRAVCTYAKFRKYYSSQVGFKDDWKNTTFKRDTRIFGQFDNAVLMVLSIKVGEINVKEWCYSFEVFPVIDYFTPYKWNAIK